MVTADAARTRLANGAWLRARNAHYVAVVKANHPRLPRQLKRLSWRDTGLDDYDKATRHHRIEIRRLTAAAFRHLNYPGARQTLQVVRWCKDLTSGKLSVQRLHFVTGLSAGTASGTELAGWTRGHWKIENQLHHVRDTTFAEDASRMRRVACPAARPPCATSRSACSARTATQTSPPPAAIPPTTRNGPSQPSESHDQRTDRLHAKSLAPHQESNVASSPERAMMDM